MYELMLDLETLDTKPSAIVLSVGAVVWETKFNYGTGKQEYEIKERFLRVLNIQEQADKHRTVSQDTILWWQRQDPTAREEAFNPVRQSCHRTLRDLRDFVDKCTNHPSPDKKVNAFWASPATFDFPIWEDLAMTFSNLVPWTYRQKYDVRTVVREANLSARDHSDPKLVGIPHTPVYDCEWQISLLTAARGKLGRRIGS